MLFSIRVFTTLCIASAILVLYAHAAPTLASGQCQTSTTERSNPANLPRWLQEDPNTQKLDFKPIETNHFKAQVGKNLFNFKWENGQVSLESHFDNSHQRIHHHHLYEVTFSLVVDPSHQLTGPFYATRYFYLKDDDKCSGQKQGVLPSNILQVFTVKMLTLYE